jgi:hypothetical protein
MEEKTVSIKMPKTTAQFCMRDLKGKQLDGDRGQRQMMRKALNNEEVPCKMG